MSYQVDSYGNAYFPAGVSVASIPATTGTQNKVLVPGPGGRISSASIAQLITQSGGNLVTSVFGRTGVVTALQGDYNTDQVTEGQSLYFTDGRARKALSVTTFNTSGPATYNSSTGILNIPQYGSGIVGNYVPVIRSITINGQTADLSADRIFSIDSMVYPSAGIPLSNGTSWGTSIVNNSANWNTAFGWGNHAGLYSLLGHTHTFASLTSIPTTLAGYGITDAATSAQGTKADTAFSWGNHALAGYLTSFTETDPTVASYIKAITTTNITNWNSAYSWGNHALAGYLTSFTETDPIWTSEKINYYTKLQADARYLQSYTETDPVWTSEKVNYYTKTAADARYLQSYTETDPVWTSEKASYALKTYVDTSISNLIDSAPGTLDTLNELAAALGDDANFSTTITTLIGTKEPAITAGTTAQYWRGDKTWQTLPVYTLSGLGGEPAIAAGTYSQYWRGDKTWQTLPVYTLSGLGGVPSTRTLTINGTSYDLSANRSWTISTGISGSGTANYLSKWTDTTSLGNSVIYDNGSAIGINTTSPFESSAFKLDVNGGVIIKNTSGTAAQLILIDSNPATGGNNGFVQLSAGGNTGTAFGQWQTYYGTSIASGTLRLQPAGGVVLIGSTTAVTGAGMLQVAGDVNITGTFKINGTPFSSGTSLNGTGFVKASGTTITYDNSTYYLASNPSGYITGITSTMVTNALGYTPYNSSNPNGYITSSGSITGSAGSTTILQNYGASVTTQAGSGTVIYNYAITAGTAGLFSTYDNSNSIITFNRHPGDYYSQLGFNSSGTMFYRNFNAAAINTSQGWQTVWTSSSLTNLNQLTNGPGYITGYTETDTLNSVTGRGNTTSNSVRFGSHADISPTNSAFRFYDGTTFRGGFGTDAWGHSGSDANLVLYVNGDNTLFFSTAGTKRASLSSSAFNSLVALQQSGNQVLHAGNYSSYAFPASGGTLNGYLTVSANWGASPYTSALTIIGTYPSITFRGSNSDWEWLQHVDSSGHFHFYGGSGYTVNSWNQKLSIKTTGQLILKNHSTADSGYDNPLWIWATQDSDAIVIQNTTSGGNAPKIYFRDTNGIIQTGNSELRLRTSNSNSYSAYLSGGDWYATGSMRAPIFYDSSNTSYYVDPDSTSNVNAITMGGTLYMNGGAYYGTIIFGSSTYWRAGISQRDAGNAELRIWAKGGGAGSIYFATGFDGEASATTLPSDGMALKNNNLGLGNWGVSEFPSYKLHVKGTGYATSDFRAPIFYDSNDTNYYLDPNGGSVLATVRTGLKAARGMNGYSGGSWIDDFANTPVSSMTFGEDKASGGPSGTWWFQVNMRHANTSNSWGTQLAYGWEDNANRMMQRNVTGGTWSAWVEYISTANIGSQSVAYASTAGSANSVAWGNVSGRPGALSQFSNDVGYITGVTNISGNAGSANVATYARRIDGVSRVQITVGGNASTYYPVALYTGAGSTSQQYSEFVIERGGYDDPGYTGVGFSTFNARFSYKPSGWGYEAKYWNLEQLAQTTTMLADYDDYYQSSQFVVWLRGGTTYWIWAIVGGISVVFENTSGTSYNATYRTFGTTTTVAAKASVSRNFYGNLRLDNNIYSGGSLISGYNVELGGSDAGNIVLSTFNNRNLRITGTGGTDVGICGRRSGGSFGFQLYGEGTSYGFLNYEWGAWNLRKVISGALYMNDNNSYYINTTGDSSFSGALTLGGTLTVAGVSTLNAQVYINRHIDANTTWGSAGVNSIFVGWGSGKVILGNGNSGGHDYANGLGGNTVVSTNPFYCYQDITAYSDSRVKENVEVVDNAVEKIKAIRGVTFTRNDVEDKNKRHAGVIAQEVLAVLPEAVSEDLNGHYSVAYGNLNALLIEAIKEQQTQIEELKNEIKELKNK